jgi:hypothetical protein
MDGPLRPAPSDDLCRSTRPRDAGSAAHGLHRGLHPRRSAAALRQHPHRVLGHRPADHPAARGCPRDHQDAVGGDDDTLVVFAGSGTTGAIDKLIGILGLRIPSTLDDRYHLSGTSRPASGRSCSSGPSSTTRTRCPGASRSPTSSPSRGPRRTHRSRRALEPSWSAIADRPLKIGSFSAASNVTGIVSRHLRHRRPVARARRAVVLGLRRRRHPMSTSRCTPPVQTGTRRPTRTRSSSRRTSSSADRAPRACSSCGASCSPTGCRTCRAAERSPTSTRPSTASSPTPSTARRAARRPSSSRSAPGWSSSSSQAVGIDVIRRREESLLRRAVEAWQAEPAIEILGNLAAERLSIVSFVIKRPRASTSTTTSSSPCSTTSSASRPGAAARAPDPTATACSASTSSARTSSSARSPRLRGHQARVGARQLQLLHLRAVVDYLIEAVAW